MKPLFFEEEDDAKLLNAVPSIGKHNEQIIKHRNEILREYGNYRSVLRSPVRGAPPIASNLKEALHAKYTEGRGGSGVFSFIEDRAEKSQLRSCPYCGRGGLGTIDHYLPKEHFPWFSVYSWNLVPSCQECQNIKNSRFGSASELRPIHPLLDSIGLSQLLVVRPIFYSSDLIATTFKMSLIPDRSFRRRVRKREKHLFQRHWKFFGRERADVISSCRTLLTDIRVELQRELTLPPPNDSAMALHWIKSRLHSALQLEDVTSDSLLYIGLLRGLCTDRYSLEQLLATQLPVKELTRKRQQALLRAR